MATEQSDSQQPNRKFRFPWWWAVLLTLLLGFALFGDNGVLRLIKAYHQKQHLQLQVEQLEQENRRLQAEIEALKKDPKAIERLARQELGMVREDEIVYQFPPQKKASKPASKPGAKPAGEKP